MKTLMKITLGLLLGCLLIPTVSADHRYGFDPRPIRRHDQARVIRVVPIVERVRVVEPYEECRLENRRYPRGRHASATPMILGGILGGLVGNQIGRGNGNTAATIAGVVLGSSIAQDLDADNHRRGGYGRPVEICETNYSHRYVEQIVGYHVTYYYRGRTYHTRSDHHPGAYITVQSRRY